MDGTTPRPWTWSNEVADGGGCFIGIYGGEGVNEVEVCGETCPAKPDARLIVRAVNAFEPMRDALRGFVKMLEHDAETPEDLDAWTELRDETSVAARAALTLAEAD